MSKLTIITPGLTAALLLGAVPFAIAANGQNTRRNDATTQSQASLQTAERASPMNGTKWAPPKAPTAADVQPFAQAKLSLAQAISNAQQQESGKAIEAQFEMLHGTPAYFVRWVSQADNSNNSNGGGNGAFGANGNGNGNGYASGNANGNGSAYGGNANGSSNGNGNRLAIWEGWVDANTGNLIGQARMLPENQVSASLRRRAEVAQNAQASLSDAIGTAQQQRGGKAIMGVLKAGSAGAAYDLGLVRGGEIHTAMVNAQTGNLK